MKKSLMLIICLSAFYVQLMQAQEFEKASDAVVNMRVGWNLGNTLDANSNDTANMWIE